MKDDANAAGCGFFDGEETKHSFAQILTAQKVEKMMTVAELVETIRRPQRTVEAWIAGEHVPDADTQAAARCLGIRGPVSASTA
jgi:hypothetical protein